VTLGFQVGSMSSNMKASLMAFCCGAVLAVAQPAPALAQRHPRPGSAQHALQYGRYGERGHSLAYGSNWHCSSYPFYGRRVYVTPSHPLPLAPAAEVRFKIVNSPKSGAAVSFLIDAQPFSLQPGSEWIIKGVRPRTIEFDRGGSFGRARYSLRSGTYTLTPTERGWELYDTGGAGAKSPTPSTAPVGR
jgi:hypothetical protein